MGVRRRYRDLWQLWELQPVVGPLVCNLCHPSTLVDGNPAANIHYDTEWLTTIVDND